MERLRLIREAAIAVFAKQGFVAATMDDIAEQADLGKATIYYYFRSKQELFDAIVQQAAVELAASMHDTLPDREDPVQAAQTLCLHWIEFIRSRPELSAIIYPLMAAGPRSLASLVDRDIAAQVMRAHVPLIEALTPLCDRLGDQALQPLLTSLLVGLATRTQHGGIDQPQQEVELFFRLLRQSCGTEPWS